MPTEVYVLLELDSYGHFFGKARTQPLAPGDASRDGLCAFWGQEFTMELEGSHMLRALLYQLDPSDTTGSSVRGRGSLLVSLRAISIFAWCSQSRESEDRSSTLPEGSTVIRKRYTEEYPPEMLKTLAKKRPKFYRQNFYMAMLSTRDLWKQILLWEIYTF